MALNHPHYYPSDDNTDIVDNIKLQIRMWRHKEQREFSFGAIYLHPCSKRHLIDALMFKGLINPIEITNGVIRIDGVEVKFDSNLPERTIRLLSFTATPPSE